MSNARVIRRPSARPGAKTVSETSSGGKRKWIVITLLLMLMMAAGAWAFMNRKDPHLKNLENLRAEMEAAPPEKRREMWGKMKEEFDQLSPEAHEQMFADRRKQWEAREQEHLNKFFDLSPKDQIAQLDKEIDAEVRRDAEREKRRKERAGQGDAGRGRGGQGGGGGPGGGGPGGGGGRAGGGGGGRGGSRDSLERRKSYLDNTSPTSRAQRSEYRRMRDERRKQRGYS